MVSALSRLPARWRGAAQCSLAFLAVVSLAACAPAAPGASPSTTPDLASPSPTADVSQTPASSVAPTELAGTPAPRPSATLPSDRNSVSVVLATWGVDSTEVSASAYVSGVVEEGGTCTLHVQSGGSTAERQGAAGATGQNTSCGFLAVPIAEAGSAPWVVWITYESAVSAGTSEQVELSQGGGQ